MKLIEWQEKVMNEEDLSVFEVISVRGSGKTKFGVYWALEGADLSIFICPQARYKRGQLKDLANKLKPEGNNFHVVSGLHQLKGIPKSKKVKVVVDEYFCLPEINLSNLDRAIGSDNYKVLFMGTSVSNNDKFKFPISKKYIVDAFSLYRYGLFDERQLLSFIRDNPSDFSLPIEVN